MENMNNANMIAFPVEPKKPIIELHSRIDNVLSDAITRASAIRQCIVGTQFPEVNTKSPDSMHDAVSNILEQANLLNCVLLDIEETLLGYSSCSG